MNNKRGFTLIELLIVVAIIAILAAIVFAVLDPLRRFQDTRDATRAADLSEILLAIKLNQIDNGGILINEIDTLDQGRVYMIGNASSGCDDRDGLSGIDCNIYSSTSCVDLDDLVASGHLGEVPISPSGEYDWDDDYTGYSLKVESDEIITVGACESENTTEIELTR